MHKTADVFMCSGKYVIYVFDIYILQKLDCLKDQT